MTCPKKKNLRTQYSRERQKTKKRKTGEGADEVYMSKWPYFECLRFLADFVASKISKSNLQVIDIPQKYVHQRISYHVFLPCHRPIIRVKVFTHVVPQFFCTACWSITTLSLQWPQALWLGTLSPVSRNNLMCLRILCVDAATRCVDTVGAKSNS